MAYAYAEDRDGLLRRLRRIEGQVRGIARMVEEDKYCVDVLTQVAAARSALDQVGLRLLGDHIRGCVTEAVSAGEGEPKVAEVLEVVERFVRS